MGTSGFGPASFVQADQLLGLFSFDTDGSGVPCVDLSGVVGGKYGGEGEVCGFVVERLCAWHGSQGFLLDVAFRLGVLLCAVAVVVVVVVHI
eukprot:6462563-Amphidinium_carterae.1